MADSSFIFPGSLQLGGSLSVDKLNVGVGENNGIRFGTIDTDGKIIWDRDNNKFIARTQQTPPIYFADIAMRGALTDHGLFIYSSYVLTDADPQIVSGFGTNPSIDNGTSTAAFILTIGTGGVASTGILLFTLFNIPMLRVTSLNGPATCQTKQDVNGDGNKATLTNYNLASGLATPWQAGEILYITATGTAS